MILKNLREDYSVDFPKRTKTAARKIVEHFFEKFIGENAPEIIVRDESADEVVNCGEIFSSEYEKNLDRRQFSLDNWNFNYIGVWVGKESATAHELVFCAHDRIVMAERLAQREPLLHGIIGPHGHPIYRAYVSGDLLDSRVDHRRTTFNMDLEGQLSYYPDYPKWNNVVAIAVDETRRALQKFIGETRQRNLDTNREYIAKNSPEFRPLLKYREEELAKIPSNAGDDRRYTDLQRVRTEWRIDLDQKLHAAMKGQDKQEFKEILAEITDSSASDLAQYTAHRRWVIDLLERCLQQNEKGQYGLEAQAHDVLWPRRTDSEDDVWYDPDSDDNLRRHNLWILDERLAFHSYLSSDKEFRSLPPGLEVPGDRQRADILIYDVPTALVETRDDEIRSVTVIELKRPERKDHDNPIQQALDYVIKIQRNGAEDPATGRRFRVSSQARFYCYICATLTDKIRDAAMSATLIQTPDELGYFGFNPHFSAYIEVMDWEKVLQDARRRNRAWFSVAGFR